MATRIRERAAVHAENKDLRPKATAKYISMSSSKIKRLVDLVRGKPLAQAVGILENTSSGASDIVKKVMLSAAANAENNLEMDPSKLYVAEIYANQGPTLKRIRARAKGSASRIRKRSSHITVILDERA